MVAVAVDGPAGAGKSSISRLVARQLEFIYVDTGALYRAIGLYALQNGADQKDAAAITELLKGLTLDLAFDEKGEQSVLVNGRNVTAEIRTPQVSMAASAVSAIASVRAFLLETQRQLAREHSVIMDGRDIGTVVLPKADVKIFLTASPEVRAKRRLLELEQKGIDTTYEDVLHDMQKRDYDDSHRAAAPLKQAKDALLLDTSALTFEQSVRRMVQMIEEQIHKQ